MSPLPAAHVLLMGTPAAQGAGPLSSPRKPAHWTPARPFLALLLLVSIKQVRAVCIIIVIVIIISCMYFLMIEASQTSFTAVWKDQNHHVGSFLPLGYSIPLSAVPKG